MRAAGARARQARRRRRRPAPASLRVAALQRAARATPSRVFPMGPASAPGPRPLGALRRGARLRSGRARDRAPGRSRSADLLDDLRDRPSAADRGALRRRRRQPGEVALAAAPQRALPRARTCRTSTCRCRSPTSSGSSPLELEFDPPFRGFAVTQPWKLAAARAGRPSEDVRADRRREHARARRAGGWRAENTDVDGVFDPLADHDTGEGRTRRHPRRRRRGARGGRRGAAARLRGRRVARGATPRRTALAEELDVDSLAWADLRRERGGPVRQRDAGRLAPTSDPSAIPAAVLENRPLVFDCVYRRDGRDDRDGPRGARGAAARSSRASQMFAAQAVRQAQLFGVADVDARGGRGDPARGVAR